MHDSSHDVAFLVFSIAWIIMTIVFHAIIENKKDVDFKRKWYPRFLIFSGLTFAIFVFVMEWISERQNYANIFFAAPIIALIIYLNAATTQFCSKCGNTVYVNRITLKKPKFCPDCGNSLE